MLRLVPPVLTRSGPTVHPELEHAGQMQLPRTHSPGRRLGVVGLHLIPCRGDARDTPSRPVSRGCFGDRRGAAHGPMGRRSKPGRPTEATHAQIKGGMLNAWRRENARLRPAFRDYEVKTSKKTPTTAGADRRRRNPCRRLRRSRHWAESGQHSVSECHSSGGRRGSGGQHQQHTGRSRAPLRRLVSCGCS